MKLNNKFHSCFNCIDLESDFDINNFYNIILIYKLSMNENGISISQQKFISETRAFDKYLLPTQKTFRRNCTNTLACSTNKLLYSTGIDIKYDKPVLLCVKRNTFLSIHEE